MAECEVHHEEFKQFFQIKGGTNIEKREFMCPACRNILFNELGYDKA